MKMIFFCKFYDADGKFWSFTTSFKIYFWYLKLESPMKSLSSVIHSHLKMNAVKWRQKSVFDDAIKNRCSANVSRKKVVDVETSPIKNKGMRLLANLKRPKTLNNAMRGYNFN